MRYAREETSQNFIAAGNRKEQVMELPVGIALKTISNYLEHLSPVLVDPCSQQRANSQSITEAAETAFGGCTHHHYVAYLGNLDARLRVLNRSMTAILYKTPRGRTHHF